METNNFNEDVILLICHFVVAALIDKLLWISGFRSILLFLMTFIIVIHMINICLKLQLGLYYED